MLSVTLNEKETDVSKVGEAAETLMEKVHEESADRLLLIDKVKDVSYIYDDLHDKLRAREAELEEEVDKSKEFNEKVEELDAWLDTAREKLATQGPISTDPAAVEKQLKEIQVRYMTSVLHHQIILYGDVIFTTAEEQGRERVNWVRVVRVRGMRGVRGVRRGRGSEG